MAQLIRKSVAQSSLRMQRPLYEINCLPGYSLFDAYQGLQKDNGAREVYRFLMGLSAKCPLLTEVEFDIEDRFLTCQATELPLEEGEPLLFCAITDGIAIGFPSEPIWDNDRLTVSFNELLPNENFEKTSKTIDNLTRSVHAHSIYERHHANSLLSTSPSELWGRREETFPYLVFGPDVDLPSEFSGSIIRRLTDLDRSVAAWRKVGGPTPPWTCRVTRESESVRNNENLLNARRFMSRHGTRELFEWHARVGSGVRIHLRFDADSKEIEIGYIGPHLPL